jgi:hypothetical protein
LATGPRLRPAHPHTEETDQARAPPDDAIVLPGVFTQEAPFLEKPFTAVGLLAKVREVLGPASETPRETWTGVRIGK